MNENNELYTLDRFEGNYAVCENRNTGEIINIEKSLIDNTCKEGDIIKFENGKYVLDNEATRKS